MSGIVGAAYDEDGNYVEDVPAYVNEEFVYVVYPFDMSTVVATAVAYPYDITGAYVDMTVPGVQGPVGAEE